MKEYSLHINTYSYTVGLPELLILSLAFTTTRLFSNGYADRRPGNEYWEQNTGLMTLGSPQLLP